MVLRRFNTKQAENHRVVFSVITRNDWTDWWTDNQTDHGTVHAGYIHPTTTLHIQI